MSDSAGSASGASGLWQSQASSNIVVVGAATMYVASKLLWKMIFGKSKNSVLKKDDFVEQDNDINANNINNINNNGDAAAIVPQSAPLRCN